MSTVHNLTHRGTIIDMDTLDTLPQTTSPSCIAPWDYNSPLDPLDTIPSTHELQSRYTMSERRARFIHAMSWGHTMTWACRYAGFHYQDTYKMKKDYPEFAAAWEFAREQAGGDVWEDRLLSISQQDSQLGAAGVATIVGLKMHKRFIEDNGRGGTGVPSVQVQIINVHSPDGVRQQVTSGQGVDLLSPPNPP